MPTPTRRDRYMGAMLGTLAGDALGAPYEYQTARRIRTDFRRRRGLKAYDYIDPWRGKRQMQAGQPTDDSELAAALAKSIVVQKRFKPADAYKRLRSFIKHRRSILTTGKAYGSGGTLRKALAPDTYVESVRCFIRGEIPLLPTNGSLMRCIPVPLYAVQDFDLLVDTACGQSWLTHRNPSAVSACLAYSVLVYFILHGIAPKAAWKKTRKVLSGGKFADNPDLKQVLDTPVSAPPKSAMTRKTYGGVLLSFRIALWASLTARSFRDGITKAIAVGGDTDTYAAIAGGILGARFGYEGIPQEWRDVLQGKEIMLGLAKGLYDLAHPDQA